MLPDFNERFNMKKIYTIITVLMLAMLTSCGESTEISETIVTTENSQTEDTTESNTETETIPEQSEKATAPVEEVGYEGMTAVYADSLKDGEYNITVDSSSSMFKITECSLKVENGEMTAKMTMSGTGYAYLYMGTGDEAATASESDYINYDDNGGVHSFSVPVEALDKEIDCAAFSKKKEEWYDRKLVFRADSIPISAFADGSINTAESLGLADGEYTIDVTLEGGSGKSTIQSPTKLTVTSGEAFAELIWSSNNYDYMIIEGEKYLPVSMEENSVFGIPVTVFDHKITVSADTTAMSQPHEIEYTLYFDSDSLSEQ